MALEPVFEKINVTGKTENLTKRFRSECRTDIDSESVKKIISATAVAFVSSCALDGDKIRYTGKTTYFICYEDGEGEIRKNECGCEFSGEIDGSFNDGVTVLDATASIEKTEFSLTGIKLSAIGYIDIKVSLSEAEQVDALIGGEGLITDTDSVCIVKPLGIRQTNYPLEEEFDLTFAVKEVINHQATAVVTSAQCGVGAVIVDGEVYLSLTALTLDGKVKKETKAFPFRAEVELEEAMPACTANATVKVKSFKTDISVAGDESSTAKVEVILSLIASAHECVEQMVAVDVFSINKIVETEKIEASEEKPCEVRFVLQNVQALAGIDAPTDGASVCALTGEAVEITETKRVENGLAVTGVLSANVIFIGGDGKIFSRKAHAPFETVLGANIPCGADVTIKATVKCADGKVVSADEIEILAEIAFSVYSCEKTKIRIIGKVTEKGEKKAEKSAISVFIASPKETLWQLAKRLNVCPSDLLTANKELQFPLTGEERIVVYRQK